MGKKTKASKKKKKVVAPQISKPKHSLSKIQWALLLGLLVFAFCCFLPALDAEFVNWDDDRNFYENPTITSINSENFGKNLKQIFKEDVIGNYNPLPIVTFAFEKHFIGLDNPRYWHLNNIILHLACVMLVFFIGLRMRLSTLASILLAGLFAIHPMRVESVAWVTERKDVLFGLFYLWGMLLYIKQRMEGRTTLRTIGILILFILSLLSKIQAVIFPISLILIDYWFDDKITIKSILNKWLYFILSLLFGIIGIYFLRQQGSLESTTNFSGFQRIFVGSFSYLIYYIKAIVPFRLSPLYPYPSEFPAFLYPSILSFVAGALALYFSYFKRYKAVFFGLAFFTANIFFMLQILGAGQGYLADRFTYIAYFGFFFIVAYYLDNTQLNISKNIKVILVAIPLLVFAVMTFQQCKIWKNSETLWTHVLKYYNKVTLPYGNRANYFRDTGQTQKALADYAATIALDATKPGPYNSRARLFFDSGKDEDLPKALQEYNKAIELEPNEGEYYTNRGATYARMGRLEEALVDLNKAIEIRPDFYNSYLNRSVIQNQMGNLDGAIADIEIYLKYEPYKAELWYECGRLKNLKNLYNDAIPAFDRAIQLNPNNGLFYIERGKAKFSIGDRANAKQDINIAKNLNTQVPKHVWDTIMNAPN